MATAATAAMHELSRDIVDKYYKNLWAEQYYKSPFIDPEAKWVNEYMSEPQQMIRQEPILQERAYLDAQKAIRSYGDVIKFRRYDAKIPWDDSWPCPKPEVKHLPDELFEI